jgi:hypothetical protein
MLNRILSIGQAIMPRGWNSQGSTSSTGSQSQKSGNSGGNNSWVGLDRRLAPSLEQTSNEAAQTLLAKTSKLGVGFEATVIGQMAQIADDEIKEVRALKANKVFSKGEKPNYEDKNVADVTVCDDVTTNHHYHQPPQQSSGIPGWAQVGLLAGATSLGALGYSLWNKPTEKPVAAVVAPDKQTPYELKVSVEPKKGG